VIVYVAKSGGRLKVGITRNLEKRFSHYVTHNPDIELIPKIQGLGIAAARRIESIVHDILLAHEDEWREVSDDEVDDAIRVAQQCLAEIRAAQHRIYGIHAEIEQK
jgi:hypothetical protein